MDKKPNTIGKYRIHGSTSHGLIARIEGRVRAKIFGTVYCKEINIIKTIEICSFNWFKTIYKNR